VFRRGLGERWRLHDENGRPLVERYQFKGCGALQPRGRLSLGGTTPFDIEADGLLATIDDDVQKVAQERAVDPYSPCCRAGDPYSVSVQGGLPPS